MTDAVLAAGAVCWRVAADGSAEVLVVFRTQHRDYSLPKGKLDPGETLPETAVREIAEETGLVVALGVPLGVVEYPLPSGRQKVVYYWAAEVDDAAIANSTFAPNDEIESLAWMPVAALRDRLTYPHDVDIVDRFAELFELGRARTFAIIALRHGKAVPPETWDGPDHTRPLMQRGVDQAMSVAPGIAAYRPAKLMSSDAARCVATIGPVSRLTGIEVRERPVISQEAYTSAGTGVAKLVDKRLARRRTTVLCSHGPVLPQIISAVVAATGTPTSAELRRAAALSTGEYAVLHVSVDHPETGVVAVEVHGPTA